MASSMEQSNLKEWGLKAPISRENSKLRRFSSSNFKSFREDHSCTTTISTSTLSSPGYTIKEEIDPSTYSFTAALKETRVQLLPRLLYNPALQAKAVVCSWEYPVQSQRLSLHSKWSDAEKYISNPLSGQVPLECLSAKTLSSRSFSTLSNTLITLSHPITQHQHQHKLNLTIKEKEKKCTTRDVGIQSTPPPPPPDLSSSSSSPIPTTPSIGERRRKLLSVGESEDSSSSLSSGKEKPEAPQVEERETKEKEGRKTKEGRERKKMMMMCSQGGGRRGCLSLKGLWQREKCKPRKNYNSKSSPKFLFHINSCYDQ